MDNLDIMDVTVMGQVNLNAESNIILNATRKIGEERRSCGEILYVYLNVMLNRVNSYVESRNLNAPTANVTLLLSVALQERMKYLITKLISIHQHRNVSYSMSPLYKTVDDVKSKLRILEEIDRIQYNREKRRQNELIIKTAACRIKTEDPEHTKLKEKAKAIQKAEQDALLYNQANMTALQAIGQRKMKLTKQSFVKINNKLYKIQNQAGRTLLLQNIKHTKRIAKKDVLFLLESEPETSQSVILYRNY